MSALPPKADMCSAQADVRYVPIADISLFIRLPIDADVQRRYTAWNYKAAPRERRGYQFCRNYPIAFLTRSSVNGAWRKRLPVSAMTAFDTAGVINGVAI